MLTGCIFKPEFSRPVVITNNTYRETPVSSETIANLKWWEIFNDKPLLDLIQGALNENRDLKVAMARVDQARAIVGVVRPDQFPRIDAAGEASRFATAPAAPIPIPILNEYSLLAPLNFEVDIWGRYASATDAKRAERSPLFRRWR
jgi:multidrug efflux system outer membrane protein